MFKRHLGRRGTVPGTELPIRGETAAQRLAAEADRTARKRRLAEVGGASNTLRGEAKRAAKQARKFKSRPCHTFEREGTCPYGDKCRFAHGKAELRKAMQIEMGPGRRLLQEQVKRRMTKGAGAAPPFARAGLRALFGDVVGRYYTEMFYVSPDDAACTPMGVQRAQRRAVSNGHGPALEGRGSGTCTDADQYIAMHSNRLCLLGIAPGHSMFQCGRTVTRVVFHHEVQISGKKKKGAVALQHYSILATVECSDGSRWPVYGAAPARLIECNARLAADPSLLRPDTCRTEGFLAVVTPRPDKVQYIQETLLSKEEYCVLRGLKLDFEE
jgi:hypothetical protein